MPISNAAILKDGVIYTGKNHSTIYASQPKGTLWNAEQGFVTDTGEFVDRVEGLKIARECGQIVKKHGNMNELYSEDMFDFVKGVYMYV